MPSPFRTFNINVAAGLGIFSGGVLLWVLYHGPTPAQVAAGSLLTVRGATVTDTRASNKACAFASVSTQLLSSYNAVDTSPWAAASFGGPASPVVTADQAVDPFGATTADKVAFPALAVGTASSVNQDFTSTGTGSYTFSSYVKTVSGTATVAVYVDGQVGSVLTYWTTLCAANSSTWTRCQASTPVLPAGTFHVFVGLDSRDSAQAALFPGAAQSFYVADSKLETGTTATPVAGTILSANQPCVDTVGLNVEGAATNLALYSEQLDNAAAWSTTNVVTVTANAGIAPDGSLTADRLDVAATSAGNFNYRSQTSSALGATTTYTWSAWIKGVAGSGTIYVFGTPDGVTYARTACAYTATAWARCPVTFTTTAAVGWFLGIGVDLRDASQSAKPANSVYACGAQLETGSFATSNITTTGTTATRATDVVSLANPFGAGYSICMSTTVTPYAAWGSMPNTVFLNIGANIASVNNGTLWVPGSRDVATDWSGAGGGDYFYQTTGNQLPATAAAHQIKTCRTADAAVSIWIDGVLQTTVGTGGSTNAIVQPATAYLGSANGTNPLFGWLSNTCFAKTTGGCP